MIRATQAVALFTLGALLAASLSATSALRLDLNTLTDKAEVIVIGKVESKEARWDAGRKGIWTHHDVEVSETLKGTHKAEIEFVTRGGVVGRKGQHVAGAGTFKVGDKYVFFLWRDAKKRLRLLGMVQGAFRIYEKNGVSRAKNSYSGLTILNPKTLKPSRRKADKLPMDFTLADFKGRIAKRLKPKEEK